MQKYNIAIVGATGNVGREILKILDEREFPIDEIYAIASKDSAGKEISFGMEKRLNIHALDGFDFSDVDIALFSPGASVSREYAPKAVKAGAVVIDNTSCFRMDEGVPLIVPEVNAKLLEVAKLRSNGGIIANPNCSTIQMLVALKPIHDKFTINHINVCTYQAVSGSGKDGVEELLQQSSAYIDQRTAVNKVYPKQIAFNTIPFVDSFLDNAYTREEMKMVWETHKILDENITVNPTAVRVPVLIGHAESIYIETKDEIDINKVKKCLGEFPGISVIDDTESVDFPTSFEHGHGTDNVYIGRIRRGLDKNNSLNLWVVADNVRKGAALNSVQIAEHLIGGKI